MVRREQEARDNDPKKTILYDSLARADLVCLSLTRRQTHEWRRTSAVRSINVYSDASPVVGEELQGMIVDINLYNGETTRLILPGSTLAYGHADTISKGVALVWALWLVAGPSADDVRWFCSLVRSLTTDGGVELHLLEIPDMIDAVIERIGGRPIDELRPFVHQDRRMFPKAMRLLGWSHQKGNIIKKVAGQFRKWPKFLGHMRVCCKTLRNETYRTHIRRNARELLPTPNSLRYFTAGFAKWRYETVPVVLTQLGENRSICERLLQIFFENLKIRRKSMRFSRRARIRLFGGGVLRPTVR